MTMIETYLDPQRAKESAFFEQLLAALSESPWTVIDKIRIIRDDYDPITLKIYKIIFHIETHFDKIDPFSQGKIVGIIGDFFPDYTTDKGLPFSTRQYFRNMLQSLPGGEFFRIPNQEDHPFSVAVEARYRVFDARILKLKNTLTCEEVNAFAQTCYSWFDTQYTFFFHNEEDYIHAMLKYT